MTDYGLDGPGSNPGWGGEIFRPYRPWGLPSLLCNGYRVFPGGRDDRGVRLTLHSHLDCRRPRTSRAIPLLTLRAYVVYKKFENLPTIPIDYLTNRTGIWPISKSSSYLESDSPNQSVRVHRRSADRSAVCRFRSAFHVDDAAGMQILEHYGMLVNLQSNQPQVAYLYVGI